MEETKSVTQLPGAEGFFDTNDDFKLNDRVENSSESVVTNGEALVTDGSPSPSSEDNALPKEGIRRRTLSHARSSSYESTEMSDISSLECIDICSGRRKAKSPRKIRDSEKKFGNKNSLEMEISSVSKSELVGEKNEKNCEHSTESGANFDERVDSEKKIENKDSLEMEISSNSTSKLIEEKNDEQSTISDADSDARGDLGGAESNLRRSNNEDSSLLCVLAGIVIKSISFQFSLFFKSLLFPVYVVYYSYMLVFNPFGLVKKLCSGFLFQNMKRIWNFLFGIVSEFTCEWLKEHRAILKMGLKCAWGLLWSAYVCTVLVGLLVSAFVMGGILIRMAVEDPIRMKSSLNFDYMQKSPEAIVPIAPHIKLNHDMHLLEKSRVLPYNHKLKVVVSLMLPESEYNQHLGIFQVRLDFLTADGKPLATSRHPCMLQYKSYPIRLLLTLLNVAPILTGYTSETQNLKISFKDLKEGEIPTAALRVVIEQRAEFSPGAGIPEMYSASLTLDSELPLLKRMLWFWKRTLYIWVSMSVFVMELVFTLLCCRPLIIPKIKLREGTNRDARRTNPPGGCTGKSTQVKGS